VRGKGKVGHIQCEREGEGEQVEGEQAMFKQAVAKLVKRGEDKAAGGG
jgi:hypothetical protein